MLTYPIDSHCLDDLCGAPPGLTHFARDQISLGEGSEDIVLLVEIHELRAAGKLSFCHTAGPCSLEYHQCPFVVRLGWVFRDAQGHLANGLLSTMFREQNAPTGVLTLNVWIDRVPRIRRESVPAWRRSLRCAPR